MHRHPICNEIEVKSICMINKRAFRLYAIKLTSILDRPIAGSKYEWQQGTAIFFFIFNITSQSII